MKIKSTNELNDNDGIGLEKGIETGIVPHVVQDTKKKDPNLNHSKELKCPYCDETFENVRLIIYFDNFN